jgi:hypothetical protein
LVVHVNKAYDRSYLDIGVEILWTTCVRKKSSRRGVQRNAR